MSFDSTFSLGDIIQLLFFFGAVAAAYFKLDKRIELLRLEVKHVWRVIDSSSCEAQAKDDEG